MRLTLALAAIAATVAASSVSAACRDTMGARCAPTKRSASSPAAPRKFEPYDPALARSGSRAGFVDIGGGTQLRIGGRVRAEYQYTR